MMKKPLGVLAVMATTLTATTVLADDSKSTADASQPATDDVELVAESTEAMTSGLRAVRDKKTGKMRAPNAKELKDLKKMEDESRKASGAASAAAAEPTLTRHADGTMSAQVPVELFSTLYGTRNADGSIEKSHDAEDSKQPVVNDDLPTE